MRRRGVRVGKRIPLRLSGWGRQDLRFAIMRQPRLRSGAKRPLLSWSPDIVEGISG
ncbi:protein of unknown function [Acidithiobacillus ferrivorans]|uniref:Transposase n=1 Tax=Acidithiobacillus ferrivorans TaxID=160808 RepID=A0ABY1MLX3_9PROT|nr:protein of unknown function [Acidithiobacillus ferrivorans]